MCKKSKPQPAPHKKGPRRYIEPKPDKKAPEPQRIAPSTPKRPRK